MLPESALHYQSIAFNRGGAPASALLSSSTMGDIHGRRGSQSRAPDREHREGRKEGKTGSTTSSGTSLRRKGQSSLPHWQLSARSMF
jgi:hypothetical protein